MSQCSFVSLHVDDLNDVDELGNRIDDNHDDLDGYTIYSYEYGGERNLEKGGFDFKNEERTEERMGRRNYDIHIKYMWLMEMNQM
jgi:hypothetical protein